MIVKFLPFTSLQKEFHCGIPKRNSTPIVEKLHSMQSNFINLIVNITHNKRKEICPLPTHTHTPLNTQTHMYIRVSGLLNLNNCSFCFLLFSIFIYSGGIKFSDLTADEGKLNHSVSFFYHEHHFYVIFLYSNGMYRVDVNYTEEYENIRKCLVLLCTFCEFQMMFSYIEKWINQIHKLRMIPTSFCVRKMMSVDTLKNVKQVVYPKYEIIFFEWLATVSHAIEFGPKCSFTTKTFKLNPYSGALSMRKDNI